MYYPIFILNSYFPFLGALRDGPDESAPSTTLAHWKEGQVHTEGLVGELLALPDLVAEGLLAPGRLGDGTPGWIYMLGARGVSALERIRDPSAQEVSSVCKVLFHQLRAPATRGPAGNARGIATTCRASHKRFT